MMHIGINGHFLGQETTGSGQYLYHLLEQLVQLELDEPVHYSVFVPPAVAPGTFAQRISALAAQPVGWVPISPVVPNENLDKLWMEQVAFPRACRHAGVELAHIPYFASPYRIHCPAVVTIHDLIPLVLPAYGGDVRIRLYMRMVAGAAKRASAVITDSAASKRDIVRLLGIPAERIRVIYLAAEAHYGECADPTSLAALRQRYELPERFLLYLGGMDQRRNIRTLLQAFARLLARLRERGDETLPTLALAGGLPAQDNAFTPDPRRMIRELGIERWVRCVGRIPEVDKPALLQAAETFVFPSIYEGFGLTPLEAMSAGTPVVVADATSLPEIVGEAGMLVAPLDVDAWAQALLELWDHPQRRAELRQRGLGQAAGFSWRRTAQETLDVYVATARRFSLI